MEQERRAQEEIEKIKLQIAALQKSATPVSGLVLIFRKVMM